MNTPISFEIAKLLKEKGFEQRTKSYTEDGKLVTVSLTIRRFIPEKIYYPAPTISEVVMWLYEKHGIWISPTHQYNQFFWRFGSYQTQDFNSPTEAYEAAINYTLNNLT